MYRCNRGFTLVELLVVITIIGVLLALLLPGVNSLREQGRQTTCLNSQKQLGMAIIEYEQAKRHLPGVLNVTPGGALYTWLEAIFPHIDRADAWATISAYNAAQVATYPPLQALQSTRDKVAVCPNDAYLNDPASPNATALLSYGVNDNFFVSYATPTSNPPTASKQGFDRNSNKVAPASSTKLLSRPNASFPRGQTCVPSTTIMIGERTGEGTVAYPRAGSTTYPSALKWIDLSWNPASPTTALPSTWYAQDWNSLAFMWPTAAVPISPNIMISAHPGIVVVVFFDGSGQKLNNDVTYPQ